MLRLALLASALLTSCTPTGDDDVVAPEADAGVEEAPPSGPCDDLPEGIQSGAIGVLDRTVGTPLRRVVLMGGGSEVDRASRAFVDAAAGGDVLVLRASGSTESYTSYFAEDLGADAASVTTLLLDDPDLASAPEVLCRVDGAEAIWLAGGDQSDYLVMWPAALTDALSSAVARGAAIGGTSAGAMAFAGLAFDAALGSVTSEEALADPSDDVISIVPSPFSPADLDNTVVDTHFVARDREGRLLAFLARALESAATVRGIGLDEGAALVIEGGAFDVVTDDGGTVSFYDATGPAETSGALNLDGVTRAVLDDGSQGSWPPALLVLGGAPLHVVDGHVE